MKKQKKVRMLRAVIQLIFFFFAPSLFSTAFAGIKSIFLAMGRQEPVQWNSFLEVTVILLLVTCILGRHFCGYACAFGSLGDAVYEGFGWFWVKCLKKKRKLGYSERMVHRLQKVKYVILFFILAACITGIYGKMTGCSPWDVFSLLTAGRLPDQSYWIGVGLFLLILIGMATQERFFCQFLCPMGAVFACMPILPAVLFRRNRENCAPKCTLCKKKCPAHLEIDGDSYHSGECISCHNCASVCPRKNISVSALLRKNS